MKRFHIPILFLLTVASPVWMAWHAVPPASTAGAVDESEHEGRITGWKIDKDGRVYLRLAGQDRKKKQFTLWFVTPPNQNSNTEFERLVLQVALDLGPGSPSPATVTVRGDDSNDRGTSPEDALELVSISRR